MTEKIKILVDDREDEKAIDALRNIEELDVTVQRLNIGDIICEEKGICIERKSMPDFFGSIRGHLQEQACNMMDNYENRFIILIGNTKELRNGFNKVPQGAAIHMLIGAMASFTVKYHTPVLWVENNSQFAYLVHKLVEKEGEPVGHELVKRKITEEQRYLYTLMDSIEGFGLKKAKTLAEKYKTLTEIKNASDDELSQLDGIGKVMVENVRKAQKYW